VNWVSVSRCIDHGPTELQEGVTPNINPPSLPVALTDSGKSRLWCPPLAFTLIQNDPDIPPASKLVT
jgi:hypothetical protein